MSHTGEILDTPLLDLAKTVLDACIAARLQLATARVAPVALSSAALQPSPDHPPSSTGGSSPIPTPRKQTCWVSRAP